MPTDPVALARALIAFDSTTPAGPPAFDLLERVLVGAGFSVERPTFQEPGTVPVENLFATCGEGRHLALAGHVDTVPPGPREGWRHDPFAGTVEDGVLYGRGAQDMKGPLAAMVAAAIDWAAKRTGGRVSLLITGDEEGPSVNGTRPLVAYASERHPIDAAIVGEPTSRTVLGDTIKVGRRGSLSGTVTVFGRQGHVAYPERALNPIPVMLAIGTALDQPLDAGSARFAPSRLVLTSIDVGNPTVNLVPASGTLQFNVRFNDRWSSQALRETLSERIAAAADGARVEAEFAPSSEPFLTEDPRLIDAVGAAIAEVTGQTPEPTTGGGTSDARFIKDYAPVIEFGPVGDRMHQADECIPVDALNTLRAVYCAMIGKVLAA